MVELKQTTFPYETNSGIECDHLAHHRTLIELLLRRRCCQLCTLHCLPCCINFDHTSALQGYQCSVGLFGVPANGRQCSQAKTYSKCGGPLPLAPHTQPLFAPILFRAFCLQCTDKDRHFLFWQHKLVSGIEACNVKALCILMARGKLANEGFA